MGFFDRIKRVLSANLNQMVSKAEDPEKILNQVIVEMNTQMVESKRSVAGAIADEKKLERQVQELLAQAKEWERKAILAVRAAEKEPERAEHFEGLAKKALLEKKNCEGDAEKYREQWTAQHEAVERLKDALRGLQQKIDEAQRKKNLLIARNRRAEAHKRIQSQLSGMQNSSAFEAFERMENKVDQIEAEVDALKELDGPAMDMSLEKEFAELEATGDADALLADLKSRISIEDKSSKSSSGGANSSKSAGSGASDSEADELMEELKRKLRDSE